jgi:predicted ATPase/class 3 adenylate cyclase
LWGDTPPDSALTTLQKHVHRLRAALEPGRTAWGPSARVVKRPPGYLLRVEADECDATRFEHLVADARRRAAAGDLASATELLDVALGLWRGPAWAEFADQDFARAEVTRLDGLRAAAVEDRVEVALAAGRHAEMIGELEATTAAYPLRERPRAQLMLALYRCGRHAEALRAYEGFRRYLGEEVGLEPSASLVQLADAIVRQEPELERGPATAPRGGLVGPAPAAASGGVQGAGVGEALPGGIVTFLFTDIEGSTRRWDADRESMARAVEQHDEILKGVIGTHGGRIFATGGDGFAVAFARPEDGLGAAIDVQLALAAARWPEGVDLLVRMGLHVGAADARGGDYFGPVVNRAARLSAIAHGGQVVCSQVAADLVRDSLPAEVTLVDLGAHRLRDLARVESVFQVCHADLRREFPPLRSLEGLSSKLPLQLTSFIARDQETRSVQALLQRPDIRLLTLTGSGGTGKTRLAIQVANTLLPEFRDGTFFVALDPVADVEELFEAVARVLGLDDEAAGHIAEEVVADHLRHRHALLLLDNFEHLLSGAPLVARLVASCPKLKVLVTSRAVLRVSGEQEFPVAPLPVPDLRDLPESEELAQYPSVALFLERAARVRPGFALTPDNREPVAAICVRLDGLPLALELAAARVKLFPPSALLARLAKPGGAPLSLLSGGARDLPARQHTLRATIAWSYDLLSPTEQRLFRWLAVFVGGCTLDAAEAVCAGALPHQPASQQAVDLGVDVEDGLASLLEKSLLRQQYESEAETRFMMLNTVHDFAAEQLAATDEDAVVRSRHARYYLDMVERSGPVLFGDELDRRRHAVEHDNIRTALRWLVESG